MDNQRNERFQKGPFCKDKAAVILHLQLKKSYLYGLHKHASNEAASEHWIQKYKIPQPGNMEREA